MNPLSELETVISDLVAINRQLMMVRQAEIREKLSGYLHGEGSDSARRKQGDIQAVEVTLTVMELEAELFALTEQKWLLHTKLRYADACRPTLVD